MTLPTYTVVDMRYKQAAHIEGTAKQVEEGTLMLLITSHASSNG